MHDGKWRVLMEKNVLEKIVASRRMPVLFIGSGISKRYLYNFPTWGELLENCFNKVEQDSFQYQKIIDELKRNSNSEFEVNVKLASEIEARFNRAFYDRKIQFGKSKNPSWVKKGVSPFKMYLSHFFKRLHLNKDSDLALELESFRKLKNKVSAVITTNYDQLLEKSIFAGDYSVFIHQNDLFSADSYNSAEIYKIHGCVTDADSIIITERDYENFVNSRKLIIAKMLTLFAESPIVFMGYSFTDENIRNIIVDFLSCLTDKELKDISDHLIFISYKANQRELVQCKRTITTKEGFDIPITEIETDNFMEVFNILNQIMPGISPIRIRETRRIIKTIVDQSVSSDEPESVIIGIDDLSNIDLSQKPIAVAIGYKENILNKYGYGLFDDKEIFEDILLDNKKFDADSMCFERYHSIAITRLLPVFKYVKNATSPLLETSKLHTYINNHNSMELIISTKIKKTLSNIPVLETIDDIRKEIDNVPDTNRKCGVILKNIGVLEADEVRKLCIPIFMADTKAAMSSTNFKRCVMCIDLIENAK